MQLQRFISLDTETTGLSPFNDRICEIAAVEFDPVTFEVIRKFHVYLNPEKLMPYRAYEIHGLSNSFLKDKPVFKTIAQEFITFVSGANLYIHNAKYDQSMLDAELERAGFGHLANYVGTIHCTLKIARFYRGNMYNKLDDLCRDFDIDNSDRTTHGALLDASLLVKVISEFHKRGYRIGLEGIDCSAFQTKNHAAAAATDAIEVAQRDTLRQAMRSFSPNGGSNTTAAGSTNNEGTNSAALSESSYIEKNESTPKSSIPEPHPVGTSSTQKETVKSEGTKSAQLPENTGLFSYKGTISRTRFVLTSIIAVLAIALLSPLTEQSTSLALAAIGALTQLSLFWIATFAMIKRCASIKASPYHVIWVFVPFAGLILFFYLLFAKERTEPVYSESKARKAALSMLAIPMTLAVLFFISGIRQVINESHQEDVEPTALRHSPAQPQVENTAPRNPAPAQSNQLNQGSNTVANEPEITTSIVSGHPLRRVTVRIQNTGNAGSANITSVSQTYWKDWTCITCTLLNLSQAFSNKAPEEPEILFFVKQPADQQASSARMLRTSFGMLVAKNGLHFNDKRTDAQVRTYIDEYEVDCGAEQLRRVCTYLYPSYFPEERPIKTIMLNERWLSGQENVYYGALINSSCQRPN